MVRLPVVGLGRVERRGGRGRAFGDLFVQLTPLLLGPAELLGRGGQVQEMDGDDRGAGAQIGVTDESVQLASRRLKPLLDLPEPLDLLGGVAVLCSQNQAPS